MSRVNRGAHGQAYHHARDEIHHLRTVRHRRRAVHVAIHAYHEEVGKPVEYLQEISQYIR